MDHVTASGDARVKPIRAPLGAPSPPATEGTPVTETDDPPAPHPAVPMADLLGARVAVRGLDDASPEVQVGPGSVHVTIDVHAVPREDLDHFVGSNLVLVWSRREPEAVCTVVQLPVSVIPDETVVRITNGVFDLTAPRADATMTRS